MSQADVRARIIADQEKRAAEAKIESEQRRANWAATPPVPSQWKRRQRPSR